MVDMLRRSLGETIDVSIDVEADVPPVIVDRGQFENALLNLAVNARDAMPQGGALKVGVARGNAPISGNGMNGGGKGFVCVTVTDTGTGMPPDVVERVFEPFFTTKAKGQGTGLGLSMVYGFVRQSGGDILVDSVKNEGTLFRLFFPVAEGEQDDSAEQEATAGDDTAILPPLTIVLAEDDGGVRTATKYILDNTGHRVVDAANGSEALDILKRLPAVDMLLTDVIMPGGMSGRDLATAAQALNPNLKVLFTSGYADGRLSMGDIVPGMTAFLPKPYTKESLINAIRALWFDRGPEEAGR
jgi:CheY-like chemotaxis protein